MGLPAQDISPTPALQAKDVSVRFKAKSKHPVTALDNFSLEVQPGQVTGLVGPDGAGKTTLLRLAAGLLVPASGSMHVLEHDVVKDEDELRTKIGYMLQRFGLYEDLSVQENLDFYADLQGVPVAERKDRYKRLLDMTDLGSFTERRAGRLSGGMKQKLGLACCLVKTPEFLLLDEPTVGVDPVSRRDLWRIVYQLVEEEHIGVLLSTSYLDEAQHCHEVVVMHLGKKLAQGSPESFYPAVAGRVFSLTPSESSSPREVHAAMMQRQDVIDASIHSGEVRTIFQSEPSAEPSQDTLASDASLENVQAMEPNFEDAFVDMLAGQGVSAAIVQGEPRASSKREITEVISVENLTKKFGSFTAVSDISFSVQRGEIFGLLGANGAGKTTTFRMLCGLSKATDGSIQVAGRDMRKSPADARARIGYMAQKFSLYQQLTVEQNLRFYGNAYGLGKSRLDERVHWALSEFGMEEKRNGLTDSLPGGFKQRLSMAAAMLHEPEILFLDEPTSGADPIARREFWVRINAFARQGVTVIVTTHFMEEAEYCDHMIIMAAGKTLAAGTPETIRALAVSPETPQPTMEDAFILLAERAEKAKRTGQES